MDMWTKDDDTHAGKFCGPGDSDDEPKERDEYSREATEERQQEDRRQRGLY